MLVPEERKQKITHFLKGLAWTGPVFEVSALNGEGCDKLCYAIQDYLDSLRHQRDELEERAADPRFNDGLE
jgi:GTP-binding protein